MPRLPLLASALGLLAGCLLGSAPAEAAAMPPKKVLFFSKSASFEHGVVQRRGGQLSFAERVLATLGPAHGFDFTFSKDGSLFTPEYLARFDVIFFDTTGDLTTVGVDGNPAMPPAGKAALLEAIRGGKGFVGAHCATDTFHSPGNEENAAPARYRPDGDRTDPYLRMLGAEFIRHDAQQPGRLRVTDAAFPGMAAVPPDFTLNEEWYSQKNFAPDLHVLLVQETAGLDGPSYRRPPYPETWARQEGRGRVFYTSMGHREDVWTNPVFQAVLLGGLEWASGRVDADITPNLARVAPQANVLPPAPPPAGGR